MLTLERLQELLSYDPETGRFVRLVSTSSRARAGDRPGYLDRSHGYRAICIDGKEYYEHRLAWLYMTGEWPEQQIDHRNNDRSDNRFSNLRKAAERQNKKSLKMHRDGTSGVKGVTWHKKAGKWMAQIQSDGKHVYLGLHDSIDEAKEAYNEASKRLHGEFSKPNE